MKSNIYNEGIEEKMKRAEASARNRQGAENAKYSQPSTTTIKTKSGLTKRGKKFIKGTTATIGAVGVMITGTNIAIGKIYQRNIDKAKIDNNEYIQEHLENEDLKYSKNELEDLKKFSQAVYTYKNSDDISEQAESKVVMVDYMTKGKFENTAKTTINFKLQEAVLYGDYKKDSKAPVEVKYIEAQDGYADMIRLKGIDGKYYSMNSFDIWSEDIPKNLKELAEDVFELQEGQNWKNDDECVKVAVKMSDDLATVTQEHYKLDKHADIVRINNKDYEKAKREYEEKVEEEKQKSAERIHSKYGFNVNATMKKDIDIDR